MRFCSMSVSLIALCLGSLVPNSFAELTVTRQPPRDGGKNYTFTCVSEDDLSALVWNYDLRVPPLQHDDEFLPVRPSSDLNCAITEGDTCIAKWENTGSWESISSVDGPMGPVFDYRWERFTKRFFPLKKDSHKGYEHIIEVSRSGAVVFSACGLADVNLLLCAEKNLIAGPLCFTITMAASPHRRSKIYSSYEEANQERTLQPDKSIVDAYEWRTFTLGWDEESKKIHVYSDAGFDYPAYFTQWINVNHLFIRSDDAGQIRFHIYDYLKTKANNAELISSRIDYSQYNYCMELLVGLCAECQLDVAVIHPNHATEHIETISGSPPLHGVLPTWKIVKINATLSNKNDSHFYLKLVTKLKPTSDDGLWAIDSIRKCKSSDDVRKSTITVQRTTTSSPFPKIGCQRLRYDLHATVDTGVPATDKLAKGLSKCNRGKLGPCCTLARNDSCKGSTICQSSGCFCAPGFRGDNCTDYDVNDMEIRNYCKHGTYNFRTGFCNRGCVGHYMPPACTIELSEPRITYVTASKAGVDFSVPMNTGNLRISYHLKPLQPGHVWQRVTSTRHPDIPLVFYTLYLTGLSASTTYTLGVIVTTAKGSSGVFPDINFTTPCKVPNIIDFKVASEGNGVVVLSADSTDGDVTAYEVQIVAGNKRLKNKQASGKTLFVERLTRQSTQFPLKVYLSTATDYQFYVTAEKACARSYPVYREYRVKASLGFTEGDLIVNRSQASIKLRVPSIVNETDDTVLNVIVKGPPPCGSSPVPGDLRKLLNMTESDQGWLAKEYKDLGERIEYLTIRVDTYIDSSGTCTLDRYGTYVIVVVAIDTVDQVTAVLSSLPSKPTETVARTDNDPNQHNFEWLLILLILIICSCTIFLWRRKILSAVKQARQMDFAAYSQTLTNWVKSTTTSPPHQPVPEDVEMYSSSSPPQTAPWIRISHSINVCDFEDYVRESVSNGLLKNQFETLPKGLIKSHKHGSVEENSVKNRYVDIIPYDDTRVILKKMSNDRFSDYINANYVHGFKKKKAYIAAQGPKPQTIIDFWRMVWETESLVICMLANIVEGPKDRERVKCEQYWPEPGDTETYGDVVVVTENNHVFSDFTFRTFRVTCNEETRTIEHLHYTSWPDHGVPLYPNAVITYLKKLHTLPIGNGPIIVHCSAGIGRTGTIILCDIGFHRAMEKQTIDMLSEFRKIRNCRLNMVDNELQYIFAHVVLVEVLASLPTELPCNDILPQMIEKLKKDLPHHIERLQKTAWEDVALHPSIPTRPAIAEQLAKNRFEELAPNSSNLVYLERYPTRNTHSDYISAVMVDGLSKTKKQYIASQLPLPSTLSDFWRLVAERRVELVIILQRPDLDDPTCCNIISDEEPFDPVPFLSVELVKSSDPIKSPRIDELVLSDTSWSATRIQQVTVVTCQEWELGKNGKPPRPEILVDLWKESERVRREKGPTLVLCHDGVTGCGLYLALSFLLERMTVERACDPIFSVRVVRQARSDFVQTREQFEYLYDAAANYIASFETYSNFA